MQPSLDNYLHVKNLRYQLIPFRHIVDQRILQYDWTRSTTGHAQKKLVSDVNFPLMNISMEKN